VERFEDHGFRGVLEKPYGIEDLGLVLEKTTKDIKEA